MDTVNGPGVSSCDDVIVPSTSSGSSVEEEKQSKKLFPIFQHNFRPKKPDPLHSIQLTIQKTAPPKMKKSLIGRKETPGLSQMILDAGQKQIGPRICAECGLLYSPGDYEDEEEHRKEHVRLSNMFSITMWKSPNIIHNYSDGSFLLLIQRSSDSKRILNRLKDFLAWLDSEVGAGYDGSRENQSNERIFLYVFPAKRKNSVRILGCAIIEVLDRSQVISYSLASDSAQPTNIAVGITRLWTDEAFRRKQIASRMCDMIRFHHGIPGCVLDKDKIGILEPSDAGRQFFSKYTDSKGSYYSYKALGSFSN